MSDQQDDRKDMGEQQNDRKEMGGVEWDGEPAGTSGAAAPGTQASVQPTPQEPGGSGQRPTRRGHEDIGDESGEPGFVGDPTTVDGGDTDGGEAEDEPEQRAK